MILLNTIKDYGTAIKAVLTLFFTAVLFLPGIEGIRSNRTILIGIVLTGLVGSYLWKYSKPFTALLAYTVVRMFFGSSDWLGTPVYMLMCYALMGVWTLAEYDGIRDKKEWVYNVVRIVAILNVICEILQAYGIAIPRHNAVDIGLGLNGNPNETSALLAICLPFFFTRKWMYGIPVVITGLILAVSTVGMLAASCVSIIYLVIVYRKKALVGMAVIIPILILFMVYVDKFDLHKHLNNRGMVYATTFKVATVKPFMGWGFGQFEFVIPLFVTSGAGLPPFFVDYLINNVKDENALKTAVKKVTGSLDEGRVRDYFKKNNQAEIYYQAHNEYLEMLFAMGFIGLALSIMAIIEVMVKGWMLPDKIPLLAFITSCGTSLVFFTWQIVPSAVVTVLTVAFILGETEERKQRKLTLKEDVQNGK